MNIYVLRESSEYADCYFVEAFRTKEEAVKSIEPYFNYKFIAGEELKLSLTEIAESEG